MDNAPTPDVPTSSKHYGLVFWVCLVFGVLLCFFTAQVWSNGQWTDEAQGYALGSLVFNGLIAYLIAGRRKVRNPSLFGLWFCGLCLLSYLLELIGYPRH